MSSGGVRGVRVEFLLLPAHLIRSVLRLVHLPAQHGWMWGGRSVTEVRMHMHAHMHARMHALELGSVVAASC